MEKFDIQYKKAAELLSREEYANQVTALLELSRQRDKSVMKRSLEELKSYYDYAVIAVLEGEIIGNATCHPAEMVQEQLLLPTGEKLKIGEVSSVVLKPEWQGQGIGSQLFNILQQEVVQQKFDAVIGGTINPKMRAIWGDHNYDFISFPGDLYQQGLTHLGPQVGIENFKREACCGLYTNIHLTKDQKNGLLTVLAPHTQDAD